MLTSLIISIALAIGLGLPHAHGAAPAHTAGGGHVTVFDTNGSGPLG